MPPTRPLLPTSLRHLEVMLTDDGSRTLRDSRLDETYHSGCGALSECLVVYLQNSGIEQLLIQRGSPKDCTEDVVRVLEIGFGTGMAWLLTAGLAEACGGGLEYISLEHQLLPADILQQMQIGQSVEDAISRGHLSSRYSFVREIEARWLGDQAMTHLETNRQHSPEINQKAIRWAAGERNHLQLILGDARDYLNASITSAPLVDAVYFDAFSPATNPELWLADCFGKLHQRLKVGGVLVSYCVKGVVRRALESVGFAVDRLPGPPGGKREVLVARRV